jgi:DNA-binding NarL/FixJ family response regulator
VRRAIVVADSGTVHAALTQALVEMDGVEIIRHASGRTHVEALVHSFAPDLVLVDEMHWPPRALARVSEVRRSAPAAAIIVLTEQLEGAWLADALRLGAAAVMPASADPETFRRILGEVLTPVPAAA